MPRAGVEDVYRDSPSAASVLSSGVLMHSRSLEHERSVPGGPVVERSPLRRTPRKSLIVVLPDDHVVSAELVSRRLLADSDQEEMDVIVACAGQPRSFATLQRRVRDLQVLLEPAGTSTEDLRELAMKRAPGDIVTLLSGSPPGRGDG